MMNSFAVFSAVEYVPPPATEAFPLLERHFKRLQVAFNNLAIEIPTSWCNSVTFPSREKILEELERCVGVGGVDKPQRIRLLIKENGEPEATSGPLDVMPEYPVRLILDSQATNYSTPFLRYKTSRRDVYDEARERRGATLKPSAEPTDPPFDVLFYNEALEMTETSIANCAFCLNPAESPLYLTPPTACGLLEGVQRAELLEKGRIVVGIVKLQDVQKAVEAGTLSVMCFNAVRGVFKGYVSPENSRITTCS